MKDTITVNLCTDHALEFATDIIGREGEGDATQFVLNIPKELSDYSIYFDVEKPSGEKFRSPRLNAENGVALYSIPRYLLTEAGEIKVQAVAQSDNGEVWKSDIKKCVNRTSINALDKLPEEQKEDFMFTAQKVLNALGQEVEKVAEAVADDPEFEEDVADILEPYIEEKIAIVASELSDQITRKLQLEPNFANDKSECTDTSKLYVLPDGFIYAYMKKTEAIFHESENKFISSKATINKRMGSSSLSAQDGYVWTGAIPVDLTKESPFRIKVEGTLIASDTSDNQKLWLCADDTGTTKLSAAVLRASGSGGNFGVLLEDGTIHADYKGGVKLSSDIITGTKFVRIGFKFSDTAIGSTSELSGVSITFLHETYKEVNTTADWHNTGHAFVPTDYEDTILLIAKKSENTANQLGLLEEKVDGLSAEDKTTAIPDVWKSSVDACIAKIKGLQSGRNTVTFAFFSDNHQNTKNVGLLIGKVMHECNIPYCFFGGDAIDSGTLANEDAMIANDKAFDESMSVIPVSQMCRAVGNHDGYWLDGSGNKNRYTRAQIYDLFLRQESIAQNKHYGGDGTFYYVDDLASSIRFVVCNMNYNTNTATNTLDTEQIEWLTNVIFAEENKPKHLVFISHQPITNNHHSNIYADTAHAIQNLLTEKINAGWKVAGWFSGHIHADRIYQTDHTSNTEANDQTTASLPWKTVTIRADHTGLCRDENLIHAISNDDQSHAIDFVTINKATRAVNITRLGIGSDRSFTY